MTRPSTAALCFGTEEPVPVPRPLTAGRLTAELVEGNLRAIRFDGHEVLRAIAYIVRDKDWGTYSPRIEGLDVQQAEDGFTVLYDAVCEGQGGERLRYHADIRAEWDGPLTFTVDATPDGDFLTNRCGFSILHPICGVAGGHVTVEHVDGSVEQAVFPELIEPWQPFKGMRAITHSPAPGLTATCRMEGDTFEMEDQRAWSDASYKTYVRPLALSWPYVLPAGEPLRQSVSVGVNADEGAAPRPHAKPGEAIPIRLGEPAGRLPKIGLIVTPEETGATLRHLDRLAELAPQTLLLHFDPTAGHGAGALRGFAEILSRYRCEAVLECVVPGVGDPQTELAAIADLVSAAGLALDAIAVSPSVDRRSTPPGSAWPACPPLEDVYEAARKSFPSIRLGGGMFSYFTELNRKHPPADLLDFVTHCTCPIVHAADDLSVMQSLESLPFILRSTRAIIGEDKPYRVGPSTIGMRQNPYGSRTMPNPERRRVPMAAEDLRQFGLFAAAWMVGYAARLAAAEVECFTLGALTGPFGLLQPDGKPTPAFHAAQILASMAGRTSLTCRSGDESGVLALAGQDETGGKSLVIANLTGRTSSAGIPSGAHHVTALDEMTYPSAHNTGLPVLTGPGTCVTLRPYAVARADIV